MTLKISGTTQVAIELTRAQMGQELQPPVTNRTVQKYLDLASLYLPSFSGFRAEEGGLNRYAKLNTFHIPTLQKIRTFARQNGMKKLRLKLAYEPSYFDTREDDSHDTDDCSRRSEEVFTTPTKAA